MSSKGCSFVTGCAPRAPKIPAEKHCKGCELYEKRVEYAVALNQLFGSYCTWNYAECYASCQEKLLKENNIQVAAQYARLHKNP